jgi:N utilization substance protein B
MYSEYHEIGGSLRHRNRVAAVQFLYMCSQRKEKTFSSELFSNFCQMLSYPTKNFLFAQTLIQGILEHLPSIDERIEPYIQHWKLSRIAMVDLCILRVAVYELFFDETVPPIVIIDEAIEIGKMLSSPESKGFINGILDRIKNFLDRPLHIPSPKLTPHPVPSYGTI